jgi:hypothetical protein
MVTQPKVDWGYFQVQSGPFQANGRAFGWRSKKADEQRGKEMARQPPAKMLK